MTMATAQTTNQTAWLTCLAPVCSASVLDKPNMPEMEKCAKSKLKTETQEKNPVPSEEAIEQVKQAGKL